MLGDAKTVCPFEITGTKGSLDFFDQRNFCRSLSLYINEGNPQTQKLKKNVFWLALEHPELSKPFCVSAGQRSGFQMTMIKRLQIPKIYTRP